MASTIGGGLTAMQSSASSDGGSLSSPSSSSSGNGSVELSKSGSKGTDCHILIQVGSGSSGDHASEFQELFVDSKMPEKDEQGNAVDPLDEFTTQTNSFKIHGSEWHYMNVFYRESVKQDFTQLKYQLLTAVNAGYYYDITLTYNENLYFDVTETHVKYGEVVAIDYMPVTNYVLSYFLVNDEPIQGDTFIMPKAWK